MKRPRVLLLNLSGIGFRSIYLAKWLHSLIHKASINIFRLVVYKIFASKVGIAKNMRDVLRKWTPREKCVKYQLKFSDTLWFVISSGMFWQNFTTNHQICIPYKFAQSGCIPSKIKCKILACKGS